VRVLVATCASLCACDGHVIRKVASCDRLRHNSMAVTSQECYRIYVSLSLPTPETRKTRTQATLAATNPPDAIAKGASPFIHCSAATPSVSTTTIIAPSTHVYTDRHFNRNRETKHRAACIGHHGIMIKPRPGAHGNLARELDVLASRSCDFACVQPCVDRTRALCPKRCTRPAIWCRNPGMALLTSPKCPIIPSVARPSLLGAKVHQCCTPWLSFLLSQRASDRSLVLWTFFAVPKKPRFSTTLQFKCC